MSFYRNIVRKNIVCEKGLANIEMYAYFGNH